MKVQCVAEGWMELESDPGLFTLMLQDWGVRLVDVEEIYDLKDHFKRDAYGFIFLFKWVEGRRRRIVKLDSEFSGGTEVKDENVVNSMFFANQIVQNSCATHALLSVMMNCHTENVQLGDTLHALKETLRGASPEIKGYSINNIEMLARAHNKHAVPDAVRHAECDGTRGSSVGGSSSRKKNSKVLLEQFHFVSYVPINGRLYELDSLKSFPIDHGEITSDQHWTEMFRRVVANRIAASSQGEEIRYNLMAVIPCPQRNFKSQLTKLRENRERVDGFFRNHPETLAVTKEDVTTDLDGVVPSVAAERLAEEEGDSKPALSSSMKTDGEDDVGSQSLPSVAAAVATTMTPPEAKLVSDAEAPCSLPEQCEPLTLLSPSVGVDGDLQPTASADGCVEPESEARESAQSDSEGEEKEAVAVEPVVTLTLPTVTDEKTALDKSRVSPAELHDEKADSGGRIRPLAELRSALSSLQIETCVLVDDSVKNVGKPLTSVEVELDNDTEGRCFRGNVLELKMLGDELQLDIEKCERLLNEEIDKHKEYEIVDGRRVFDFDPLIRTFLGMLVEHDIVSEKVMDDAVSTNENRLTANAVSPRTSKWKRHRARQT